MCASFPDAQTQRIFLVWVLHDRQKIEEENLPRIIFLELLPLLSPGFLNLLDFSICQYLYLKLLKNLKCKSKFPLLFLLDWHRWSSVVCLEPIALWSLWKIFWHQTPPQNVSSYNHLWQCRHITILFTPVVLNISLHCQLKSTHWTYWSSNTCGFLFAWFNFGCVTLDQLKILNTQSFV